MMNRRVFLLTSAGSLLCARSAFAAVEPEDQVARSLKNDGFRIVSQKRTLLGRVRFVATRGPTEREVVLDPSSGEILRDYSRTAEGDGGATDAASSSGSSSGTSSSGGGASSSGGEPSGDGTGSSGGESPGDGTGSSGGEPSGGGGSSTGGEPAKEPAREPAKEPERAKSRGKDRKSDKVK